MISRLCRIALFSMVALIGIGAVNSASAHTSIERFLGPWTENINL